MLPVTGRNTSNSRRRQKCCPQTVHRHSISFSPTRPAGILRRQAGTAKSRSDPVKRVLTARFMHETNTFSRVPTDMAMIRRRDYHLENEIPEAFRGTRSAFGATFEAADKF